MVNWSRKRRRQVRVMGGQGPMVDGRPVEVAPSLAEEERRLTEAGRRQAEEVRWSQRRDGRRA